MSFCHNLKKKLMQCLTDLPSCFTRLKHFVHFIIGHYAPKHTISGLYSVPGNRIAFTTVFGGVRVKLQRLKEQGMEPIPTLLIIKTRKKSIKAHAFFHLRHYQWHGIVLCTWKFIFFNRWTISIFRENKINFSIN